MKNKPNEKLRRRIEKKLQKLVDILSQGDLECDWGVYEIIVVEDSLDTLIPLLRQKPKSIKKGKK